MSDAMEQVRQLLDPILESMGLSLWDLEFHKQGPRWLLRIFIDRESGDVTLGDCETVSRDLSAALDVEDIISHAYTLEVSSPGLDRTLSKPAHFVRFTGSTIRIKTYRPIEFETGKVIEIPMTGITRASLEVEF
jgi:ribosome maturation factor RimP